MSPVGLRSEKGCAGDAHQRLKSTDPTSRQRGRPTSTNPKLSKNIQRENGKNWSRVPDGCLTPGRIGRLTVGRNITLTLTLTLTLIRPAVWSSDQSSWLQNEDVLFPVRYELDLYMLCRRKSGLGNRDYGSRDPSR
jgi:hypothetical protein